jgi:hypothetical protein
MAMADTGVDFAFSARHDQDRVAIRVGMLVGFLEDRMEARSSPKARSA